MIYWDEKPLTVRELIEELSTHNPENKVMIAYDSGLRMNAEVVGQTHYDDGGDKPREQVVVVTNRQEWDSRENW